MEFANNVFMHTPAVQGLHVNSTNLKEFFMKNPVLRSALKNTEEVTHVVTYVEYGSALNIELEYEGK